MHTQDDLEFDDFPRHCVRGTRGPEFVLQPRSHEPVFYKDTFSGFTNPSLLVELRQWQISELHICGVATDYCVRATAMDAIARNFKVSVLLDACRSVARPDSELYRRTALDLQSAGCRLVHKTDLVEPRVISKK